MGKRERLSGNEAVAIALRQINPDVFPAFPITPSTEIPQYFASFVANGEVETEFITVESEHSSMSATIGASAAGARALTATSSCGLAYMWEELYIAASNRLPLALALVNRALSGPININCDHSDSMGARDAGWIQIYAENNQEAYDNMVQALSAMEIPYQSGDATSDSLSTINGKTYEASVAGAGISSFRFDFSGDEGTLTYNTPRGEKTLSFGIGKNVECLLDEPQYSGDTIGVAGGKGYRALCSGAWKSDTVFVLKVQVVDDYFGNMTFVFNLGATPTLNVTKNAEWFLEEYKMKNISYEKH